MLSEDQFICEQLFSDSLVILISKLSGAEQKNQKTLIQIIQRIYTYSSQTQKVAIL